MKTKLEYSAPIYRIKLVKEATVRYGACGHASQAAEIFGKMLGDSDTEKFGVILLDTKMQIVGATIVAAGTMALTTVAVRDIFKAVILASAYSIIVGHNHPSGVMVPSAEDEFLTRQILDAGRLLGVPIMDHIIVGPPPSDYFSFAENERIPPANTFEAGGKTIT